LAISGELIGETGDDFLFTVGFTPETAMSTPGSIQINVPLWYAYYDIELGEEVDQSTTCMKSVYLEAGV
jgi:hypothetical protein